MEEDMYLYPHLEYLREMIHSRELLESVEDVVGGLL
jgi:histidine ammonia-lyase